MRLAMLAPLLLCAALCGCAAFDEFAGAAAEYARENPPANPLNWTELATWAAGSLIAGGGAAFGWQQRRKRKRAEAAS